MNTKFYTRRDSATTVLRKAGITPRDYDLYLTKSGDGVDLNLDLLAIHKATTDGKHDVPSDVPPRAVVGIKSIKPIAVGKGTVAERLAAGDIKVNLAKTHKETVSSVPAKPTVSSVARVLLLAGATTDEVWEALKEQFKLSDGKKHYPSWYRAQLRRQGKLA